EMEDIGPPNPDRLGTPDAVLMRPTVMVVVLDAWSRTYLSTAWAVGPATVISRRGLMLHPSPSPPSRLDREVPVPNSGPMASTFEPIRAAYGEPTARLVALQFEHPYGAASAW
ncbi:hypothetical protein ACIKTA_17410, partial [Hansschlegelia beijingensis]